MAHMAPVFTHPYPRSPLCHFVALPNPNQGSAARLACANPMLADAMPAMALQVSAKIALAYSAPWPVLSEQLTPASQRMRAMEQNQVTPVVPALVQEGSPRSALSLFLYLLPLLLGPFFTWMC